MIGATTVQTPTTTFATNSGASPGAALAASDGARSGTDHLDLVDRRATGGTDDLRGGVEHLERSRDVEQLHVREHQDHHSPRAGHLLIIRPHRLGRNDNLLTYPATGRPRP
jgi:hypothetical protein